MARRGDGLMPASIQILGLDPLTRRVKTWPQTITRELRAQVLVEVRPLVTDMRGLAHSVGGSAVHAARHLRIVSTQDGMSVAAGGDPVIFGAEFGSKRNRRQRRRYIGRSRAGRGYIVKRRTTMQFKPHLGRRGYWFWPTVRTDLKGINKRVYELLVKAVNP